ncbi:MAG: site-specific DNA-methyltransferase [Chloroflexi bacterium]|nr:MAG: site-specific DNA-methyltransferase [Chloroflexota bacterium]MBL1194193.1 site-specific DNA-methyltransferase [Chloroflexota bacterium]NOH11486.1 site-specific DNA-methyltransferase [Chloroflexota bacterium]
MRTSIQLENTHRYALPVEFQDDDVRYSEGLVEYFLDEFTQENEIVFDPFAGFGTTLLVAEDMGRVPIGIEFDEGRVQYIQSKLKQRDRIIHGDARQLETYNLPTFNFSITSPPYMGKNDIGNPLSGNTAKLEGYPEYLRDIRNVYKQLGQLMAPDATVVIEVANIKQGNSITTLAWDIAMQVSQILHFEGEVVVNWDEYGYGYDHSYCLVFTKPHKS